MSRVRNRGFTLVEIMIVVLIIGILLAIAVPNWNAARTKSRLQGVLGNLQQIFTAKEQFTEETGLANGAAINDASDLAPTYLKAWPIGPVQGTYNANVVGVDPTFNGQTSAWYQLHCSGPTADSSCTL